LIELAVSHCVNFIVGLDLHNLKMFGSDIKSEFIIDEKKFNLRSIRTLEIKILSFLTT